MPDLERHFLFAIQLVYEAHGRDTDIDRHEEVMEALHNALEKFDRNHREEEPAHLVMTAGYSD